jgi:hypothetical protein
MDPYEKEFQQEVLTVQTNFRSFSGQLFKTMFLPLRQLHPHRQGHITVPDLQMLNRDYLGEITSSLEHSNAFLASIKNQICKIFKSKSRVWIQTTTPIPTC